MFICRIASHFLLQRLNGITSDDARDFNNIETQAFINCFSLQGKSQKEFHTILTEILREHAPSYATVKNWVTQFKRGVITTCEAPRPGRPKTVTIPGLFIKFTS